LLSAYQGFERESLISTIYRAFPGEAVITVSGEALRTTAGEAVLMPANQPHALKALSRFKMLLTMIRS
jgi:quercetin dioxygenase-like cupin family protein